MINANQKMPKGKEVAGKAGHIVDKVFSKIGEKTGVDKKRVNEWQKKWLAVPKNRTKYESLKDAPMVMGEEIFAMSNDIIEFCQGEHSGESHVFGKIKAEAGEIKKDPGGYFKHVFEATKERAMKAKAFVQEKTKGVKAGMEKAKKRAADVKKMADKTKKAAKKATK
jgi:hypothetical protein